MYERWSIILHGGAKTISPENRDASRIGCMEAVRVGQAVLIAGGSALDAAVAAVRVLEDDPTFNAGYGSVLNADGVVEADAAVMDGQTLDVGAVAALQDVENPVDAARLLLREDPVLLVGDGARRFAAERGIPLCEPGHLISPQQADARAARGGDTVGCLAYDAFGNLAVATSTGGLSGVRAGRVGDAPIPGCGFYAENGVGGVAFSGDGESMLRLSLSARLMADLTVAGPRAAADQAIARLPRVGGEAGCIVMDAGGEFAVSHNSRHFAIGLASSSHEAKAYLEAAEFYGE